jgi:hypothetical protein
MPDSNPWNKWGSEAGLGRRILRFDIETHAGSVIIATTALSLCYAACPTTGASDSGAN